MSKLFFVFAIVVIAVSAQGFPYQDDDIASAAAKGDWDTVNRILSDGIRAKYELSPVDLAQVSNVDVKNLKPVDGGHVYGESNFQFHSASNINGHTSEQSGGHKVINDDGRVTEFNYKP